MPFGRDIVYEIHGCSDDKWTIRSSETRRTRAIQQARELLAGGKVDAVKVTCEGGRKLGEDVVFEEKGKGRTEKPVTIVPLDDAPVCAELEDFYGFEARVTIGRLLRKYLDLNGITALELLHNQGHMKWLARNDNLVNQAIQNVAKYQSKKTGERLMECIDHLYDMVGRITARALSQGELEKHENLLAEKGLKAAIADVSKEVAKEDRDFYIRSSLAAHIGEEGDWEGKLLLMIALAEKDPGKHGIAYVDEVIAELFDGAGVVKELLGYQLNLAESLQALAHLSHGSYRFRKGAGAGLERLNALRTLYPMPLTKAVMLKRVERGVGGVKPLAADGGTTEEKAFSTLLGHLVKSEAILEGGGGMGEAVTLRAKSTLSADGDESTDKAIDDLLEMLPTKADKFGYLVDLCATDFGDKYQPFIISRLAGVVQSLKSIADIVHQGAGQVEIIQAAAGVRDRLLLTNLPDEWRLKFARTIYTLLLEYTEEGKPKPEPKAAPKAKGAPKDDEPLRRRFDAPVPDQLGKKTYAAGEAVFTEGEVGVEAYMIESGEVEISRKCGEHDVVLAKLGVGAIIGEMAIIDSMPRMATAKALKKTTLKTIPMADLQVRLDRLAKFDPVMRRLVGMLVERMRQFPLSDT